MAIYAFEGVVPVVHRTAFVHPLASVTGRVHIGKDVYIGPGASLRGDFGTIIVEDGSNIQDNCILHMFPGHTIHLEKNAHIGHGAILHGVRLGKDVLVGMNSVLLDDVVLGDGVIVGAMSLLPTGMEVADRKLVMGNPAKVVKEVSDAMLKWKKEGTRLYQALPAKYNRSFKECEPLRSAPIMNKPLDIEYTTWAKTKAAKGKKRKTRKPTADK